MAKDSIIRKRIFDIIQIGNKEDIPSAAFDIFITIVIFLNLFATLFSTFKESVRFENALNIIETVTVIIFTVEYALRVLTADYLYPKKNPVMARVAFIFSFYGLIDLFTILPFYLPVFFPAGAVAFRIFRGTKFEFKYENKDKKQKGVKAVKIDGKLIKGNCITKEWFDGKKHKVTVEM